MRVAILQSSYIPWKGYFDLINRSDLFVFYDDVQYTVRDWRSRNRIKTAGGVRWLTVPCGSDRNRLICEVELRDPGWQRAHWDTIRQSYSAAPFFSRFEPFFREIYLERTWTHLSALNQHVTRSIAREILSCATRFEDSRVYRATRRKQDRILELLDKIGGVSEYVTGPSARDYLEAAEFDKRGIRLTYMDYSGYPEYPQLFGPPFVHEVSILDLIFNTGPDCTRYMKSFGPSPRGGDLPSAAPA